jgi:lipopolysaccharide export system protein LptA
MLFFVAPLPNLQDPPPVQERQTQQFGELRVEYDRQASFDFASNVVTFEGSVQATYDVTVIRAERLTLYLNEERGVATGGVELTDPDGYLTTDELEFNWAEKTGFANNVRVKVGNVRIRAESLKVTPEEWRLEHPRLTLSRAEDPQYEILARTARIYPGRYGVAEKVSYDLFGLKVGNIPEVRFDLDPRIDGFNMPSLAERKGVGFGVSWASSFLLNDQTVLSATWATFPNRFPGYGVNVIFMNADPDTVYRVQKPQDDLKEQTGDGWFDNIDVLEPRSERASVSSPRVLYMLGTKWNLSTSARPEGSNDVSKAFEGVMESAGSLGGFGVRLNSRFQTIREGAHDPFVNRIASHLTVLSPMLYLGDRFGIQVRGDLLTTFSENTEFGWFRAQAGMYFSPIDGVMLGVAYSDSREFGTPDFGFDRRLYDRAVHARLDYRRGPYTFRYLVKYDPVTTTVFDREWEVALVAESFEPFAVFREFPSDYRIGVRFRIDDFVDRLQRRQQKRGNERPF